MKRRSLGATAFLVLAAGVASGVGGAPTQQAKLTASDGANSDMFGALVRVSGDTLVTGSAGAGAGNQGAAYVFTGSGTTWAEQQKLSASDPAASDLFGASVAVGGETAVVGASGKSSSKGAAYVFTRTGTNWTQQAKLTPDDPSDFAFFGHSAALEGDTIILGADGKDVGVGAAYVFTRTGAVWTQQAKLAADDAATGDQFGLSVAVAGDTALVGAYTKNSGQGAAYVFTRSGTTWTQQAKLTASDPANNDRFGIAVALAGDTAVAAADAKDQKRGAAYVFTRTGATWTQQAKLTASDAAADQFFGASVAVEGDSLIAGSHRNGIGPGAAYVFARTGTNWTEMSKFGAAGAVDTNQFGAVAIAGQTAFVGAHADASRGAVYVFDLSTITAAAPAGYCLPTKVKATANAKFPAKSTLTASGLLDTGGGVPVFTGAATFDVGGFHLVVPAFVAKGKTLTYAAGGITLTITPAKNGSSRATFSVKAVGDLTGKVDLNGPLAFRFKNAVHDLLGAATLKAGVLAPRAVTAPTLWATKAAATIKGAGKDVLALTLGFATDGVVPAVAEDLTIAFGATFTSTLAGGWVKKGATWTHAAKAPGITKATIDYAKGTITIAGSKLDLGAFAQGGNAVAITITRGADVRSAAIRMALAKTKLAY